MKSFFLALALLVAVLVPNSIAGIRTASARSATHFITANGVTVGLEAQTFTDSELLRNSGASELTTGHVLTGGAADDETIGAIPAAAGDGQTLSSSWVSGGTTHTLATPRKRNENATVWAHRHQTALSAVQAAFPPGV